MSGFSPEIVIEKVTVPRVEPAPPPTEELGALAGQLEDLEHMPRKHVMAPVHKLLSVAMRGIKTNFEEGAIEDICEHRDAGGSFLILMSHLKRWEIPAIGEIAESNACLRHLRYRTGITARRDMGELLFPIGYIIRNSGCQFVDRTQENLHETPEEKEARKERNQQVQAAGGRFMAHGGHWLVFPEGGSKVDVMDEEDPTKRLLGPDGKPIRETRNSTDILPLQMGYVYSLAAMTPEERKRVKILGMVAHYGPRFLSVLRPTIVIPRLVTPAEGDYDSKAHREVVLQQGQDMFEQAKEYAIQLDALR